MPDVEIIIGAKTDDAVKNIDKLNNSLSETAKVGVKVDKTLSGSVKGINQAGQALTNVGRVAQDLPFGFIGIQNNLNPLLESFQRLKVEAGSNVGALKALASSLIGAGGIGLALSIVSSGILLYQKYMQGSTDEVAKNTDAIKLSINEYDRFAKELEQVTATMGTEAAKVSILFSALSDNNIGLRERKGILEQLNQISPGYLGNLDKEKAAYDEIAKAVFAYTESLAKSSEIKALLPQVDKLFQSLIDAQVQLNQLRRFQGKDQNDPGFLGLSPEDFKTEEARLLKSIKNFGTQIQQAKAGLTDFAGGALSLSEILFGKTPELSKPTKEVKERLRKGLKFHIETIEELAKQFFDESTVRMKVPASVELDFKKSLVNNDPLGGLSGILGPEEFDRATKEAKLLGMGITKGVQDGINVSIKGLRTPQLNDLFDSASKSVAAFSERLSEMLSNTFSDIAVGIGEALGSGDNLFTGFLRALGNGLKTLGAYMISMSAIIKGIKTAIKTLNPTLLLIGGVALVAIGAALTKAKIPGFAGGVTNFSGGLALVGERGPELVRLPRGSDVIPNHRLGTIGAAGAQVFIPDIKLRGSDMVVVFNRASSTIGRNT